MPVVTQQPVQLSYFVADPATELLTYNRLRFWRSRTGQDGLYEPATAAAAAPAELEGTSETPHQLNGKTLSFRVSGVTQVDVLFADPDPVTTTQVVAAITGATALVVATDVGGKLHLASVATGSGASIEILECDAAPFLGFDVGQAAVGLDADLVLTAGVHEYLYTDQNSSVDFWYRVELLHSVTAQTKGAGPAFQAGPIGTPNSTKIWCYIRLTDLGGRPLAGRIVTLLNPFIPNTVVSGASRWGIFRHYAQMTTDSEGYAQIRALRGMQVDVAVDGTNFIRRLGIPTTGDSVDLLDPSLVVEDEFGIQEPNIDFAVRTS
jgi:hypothetical protein